MTSNSESFGCFRDCVGGFFHFADCEVRAQAAHHGSELVEGERLLTVTQGFFGLWMNFHQKSGGADYHSSAR